MARGSVTLPTNNKGSPLAGGEPFQSGKLAVVNSTYRPEIGQALKGALAALAKHPNFILVRLVPSTTKPGRTEKVPFDWRGPTPDHPNWTKANAHDPALWLSAEAAIAQLPLWGDAVVPGDVGVCLGFVLTREAGIWCLDVDHCIKDGKWTQVAEQVKGRLPGAAIELSQSGEGLHLWFTAGWVDHTMKCAALHLELYSEARFIALTGNVLAGDASTVHDAALAPLVAACFPPRVLVTAEVGDGPCAEWRGPADDEVLIERMLRSTSAAAAFGGKAGFADLWTANVAKLSAAYPGDSSRAYDASNADAALAQHLAFWTGKDAARIERLMRRSALAREKWDSHPTYLTGFTITNACRMQREVLQDAEPASPQTLAQVAGGAPSPGMRATLPNILDALRYRQTSKPIVHDRFTEVMMVDGRPYRDEDHTRIRDEFERGGFKPIKDSDLKQAIRSVADENTIDSAQRWAEGLVWDGAPRIDAFLSNYLGAEASPYVAAVSAYLWTALAGRLLDPGCKADMVPILVGEQGAGKSTALRAMVPVADYYVEIGLAAGDADTARLTKGKLIGEIAELRGLSGRDRESVKAWITRPVDEWVPKYRETPTQYPRRIIFVGTTNEDDFLCDSTGERRWLPVRVGRADLGALGRDRDQLWAEGLQRFMRNGIAWQEAERLARDELHEFKQEDTWVPRIRGWVRGTPCGLPKPNDYVTMDEVLTLVGAGHGSRPDLRRAADCLRTLGFERRQKMIDGHNVRVWRVPEALANLAPLSPYQFGQGLYAPPRNGHSSSLVSPSSP